MSWSSYTWTTVARRNSTSSSGSAHRLSSPHITAGPTLSLIEFPRAYTLITVAPKAPNTPNSLALSAYYHSFVFSCFSHTVIAQLSQHFHGTSSCQGLCPCCCCLHPLSGPFWTFWNLTHHFSPSSNASSSETPRLWSPSWKQCPSSRLWPGLRQPHRWHVSHTALMCMPTRYLSFFPPDPKSPKEKDISCSFFYTAKLIKPCI